MPFLADEGRPVRLAVGLLAAAVLVARSPSSAIAIVSELRFETVHAPDDGGHRRG
ncbi:MAG: hypothetical protein R2991_10475 [Thermoanaerobaculia bacterium]